MGVFVGDFAKVGRFTSSQLAELVESNEIETVIVAMVDMQGRLQGKRCDARYFIDEAPSGTFLAKGSCLPTTPAQNG